MLICFIPLDSGEADDLEDFDWLFSFRDFDTGREPSDSYDLCLFFVRPLLQLPFLEYRFFFFSEEELLLDQTGQLLSSESISVTS
jgi:hypothetical protein